MALKRTFSPVLDSGLVNIGDGAVRTQSVKIASGEYSPPIWLRTEGGLVMPVSSLPYQGVLRAGQLEVLSEDPVANLRFTRFLSEWSTALGTSTEALLDQGRSRPWTSIVRAGGAAFGPGEVLSSAAEGRNFAAPTFYRNIVGGSLNDQWQQIDASGGYVPVSAVGECVTCRSQFAVVANAVNEPNLSSHPFYFHAGGGVYSSSSPLAFDLGRGGVYTTPLNTWFPSINVPSGNLGGSGELGFGNGTSSTCCQMEGLAYDDIYEVMLRYRRTATDQWQIDARIYEVLADGSRGSLLYAESSWHGIVAPWNAGNLLQDRTFDDGADGGASRMVGFRLGREGGDTGSAPEEHAVFEFTAFRIDQGPTVSVPWPVPEYTAAERSYGYGA